MATLRLRFKLNPDRPGVSLSKLSTQTENIEMFVRSLAADLGIQDMPHMWLAKDFKNGSCISTAEMQSVVDGEQASQFNAAAEALAKYRPSAKATVPSFVSASTIGRFAELREGLDAGEPIGLGTFDVASGKPKRWMLVDRLHFETVAASIETELVYMGSVMGFTHDWVKGAKIPYITIREINTAELIRCAYSDDDYSKVAELFRKKTAVVVIGGTMKFNRLTSKTEVSSADSFEFAPEFSDADFEKFFGCAPGLTGAQSTDDFIAGERDGD